MSRAALRTTAGTAMATITGLPVFGPAVNIDRPDPTSDPSAPARYVEWDFGDEEGAQISMGGCRRFDGFITVTVWVEEQFADLSVEQLIDTVNAAVRASDASDIWFEEPALGDLFADGEFVGRELNYPYIRFEEA